MEWISVENKLPIEEGKILVLYGEPFFGYFNPEIEVGYYEDEEWRFWLSDKVIRGSGVTHWMPLPEPPSDTE